MASGPAPSPLWRSSAPLLLASTSATRRTLLESAGLSVETEAPGVDERALEGDLAGAQPALIAGALAREKALAVSRRRPGRVVVGADQTLDANGALFHKPGDRAAAEAQLARLSGRTHRLVSAFAVARDGGIVAAADASAHLAMRALSPAQIGAYVALAGEAAVTGSVGGYRLEGLGVHLFERVEGDHATILGLPLLPLLASLRGLDLLSL